MSPEEREQGMRWTQCSQEGIRLLLRLVSLHHKIHVAKPDAK